MIPNFNLFRAVSVWAGMIDLGTLRGTFRGGDRDYGKAYREDFRSKDPRGKHEPIISKRLFDEVQAVMDSKSKPKTPQLKPYLYRGFFRCGECGCFITTEIQTGHNYLRCTKR